MGHLSWGCFTWICHLALGRSTKPTVFRGKSEIQNLWKMWNMVKISPFSICPGVMLLKNKRSGRTLRRWRRPFWTIQYELHEIARHFFWVLIYSLQTCSQWSGHQNPRTYFTAGKIDAAVSQILTKIRLSFILVYTWKRRNPFRFFVATGYISSSGTTSVLVCLLELKIEWLNE